MSDSSSRDKSAPDDPVPYPEDCDYRIVDGEKLRMGYTTGACAAGAAGLAAELLVRETDDTIDRDRYDTVTIDLPPPENERLTMPVEDVRVEDDTVRVGVLKFAGDDPDVTDGMTIYATVTYSDDREEENNIPIEGGTGVGTVTQPGLKLPPGEPAINPVPREMIRNEINERVPEDTAVHVTISAPGGEEVTEKTYNRRLGIEDGISILGTTGKVEPMSLSAWKASLLPKLDQAKEQGHDEVVLVSGRTARSYMIEEGYDETAVAEMSNFVGDMLKRAAKLGFERAILASPAGKLVKVAAGISNTYSRIADARFETIIANAALEGVDKNVLEDIQEMTSADVAFRFLRDEDYVHVIRRIVKKTVDRAEQMVQGELNVEAVYMEARGDPFYSTLNNEL